MVQRNRAEGKWQPKRCAKSWSDRPAVVVVDASFDSHHHGDCGTKSTGAVDVLLGMGEPNG